MALTDAFPGAPGVADSVDLRKGLAGLIVRDTAGVARAGIFPRHTNALVTSRADMLLNIAAFEGVSVRGGGPLFMANDGIAQSPALAAAPASNSRIDVLYFKQNENGYNGFADGLITPVFGVVTGTAAASPTKPSIAGIAGATELATVTIPSTATATNSSGVVITQTFAYTAAAGGAVHFRTNAALQAETALIDGTRGYDMSNSRSYIWADGKWSDAWNTAGTVTLASGITAVGTEVIRSGNVIYLNIREAQRTAAWAPGSLVATITTAFAPTSIAIASASENSTGVGKHATVSATGQVLIYESSGSGSAGRVSITAVWIVAP